MMKHRHIERGSERVNLLSNIVIYEICVSILFHASKSISPILVQSLLFSEIFPDRKRITSRETRWLDYAKKLKKKGHH